jgi:hypothetical protein
MGILELKLAEEPVYYIFFGRKIGLYSEYVAYFGQSNNIFKLEMSWSDCS